MPSVPVYIHATGLLKGMGKVSLSCGKRACEHWELAEGHLSREMALGRVPAQTEKPSAFFPKLISAIVTPKEETGVSL